MFGMSGTEMIIILVLALLLFGPNKLPEMARLAGKTMREFQKATNDIRSTVESEFNKLAEMEPETPKSAGPSAVKIQPAPGTVASNEPQIAPAGLIASAAPVETTPTPEHPAEPVVAPSAAASDVEKDSA